MTSNKNSQQTSNGQKKNDVAIKLPVNNTKNTFDLGGDDLIKKINDKAEAVREDSQNRKMDLLFMMANK